MTTEPLIATAVMPGEWDVPRPETQEARESEIRMWAAVRMDIWMPEGKIGNQAGHAFVGAFARAPRDIAEEYMSSPAQAKIVLGVKNEAELLKMYELCKTAGLPTVVTKDQARTVFGERTYTVMAVGPCRSGDLPKQFTRLRLLPEGYMAGIARPGE
jgi:peptidyl-tRNA hydrolase